MSVGLIPPPNPTGALVLLEQHTASSSANLDFTTAFTSTYDTYQVEVVAVTPATNAVTFQMQVSTDGGSTWQSSTYSTQAYGQANNTGVGGTANSSTTLFTLGDTTTLGNASTASWSATMKLYNMLQAAKYFSFQGDLVGVGYSDGADRRQFFGGSWHTATAVNALRFKMSSGDIASGVIRVYGLSK